MRVRSLLAVGALSLLPAIEVGARPVLGDVASHRAGVGALILTFVPGCEVIPPRVTSVYSRPGKPTARPRNWPVEVFLAGDQPKRRYVVIGTLQVATGNRNTSLLNLLDYARREARRLGGDAIVDVRPPVSSDRRGQRILTAKVASWV